MKKHLLGIAISVTSTLIAAGLWAVIRTPIQHQIRTVETPPAQAITTLPEPPALTPIPAPPQPTLAPPPPVPNEEEVHLAEPQVTVLAGVPEPPTIIVSPTPKPARRDHDNQKLRHQR
jgi:hypothetical protein